jgi:hypothetical protein
MKVTYSLRDKIPHKGSASSIIRLLKNLDFQCKRTHDGHKFLMQQGDIFVEKLEVFTNSAPP